MQSSQVADTEYGGFGTEEKYPFFPQLIALAELQSINPDPQVEKFISLTADSIFSRGILDHLGGGLFRYSEARDWNSPHFEQMLYSQALGLWFLSYLNKAESDDKYQYRIDALIDHVLKHFRSSDGWYVSSLSSVSESGEDGGYYYWQPSELENLLGSDWKKKMENITPLSDEVLPAISIEDKELQSKLLAVRSERELNKDTKVLFGWNGLLLSGFSKNAKTSAVAVREANNLAQKIMDLVNAGTLRRAAGQGHEKLPADLETYVYLAKGLHDWLKVSKDPSIASVIKKLLVEAAVQFHKAGFWYSSSENLLVIPQGYFAKPDTQLPSTTALWLRMAHEFSQSDDGFADKVEPVMKQLNGYATVDMVNQTFFHSTLVATLVSNQLQSSNKTIGQ